MHKGMEELCVFSRVKIRVFCEKYTKSSGDRSGVEWVKKAKNSIKIKKCEK